MDQTVPDLDDPPAEPLPLFAAWLAAAEACAEIRYATAVCLSTVDAAGWPDGRIVLLEGFDADGFVFFTDERSVKARQLAERPAAALTFYWGPLERQVRVRGAVSAADGAVADACFTARPRRSRITAWAAAQSAPLASRAELAARYERWARDFAGREEVPRPPCWRAYRLAPQSVEFWRAGACRLHDRLLYIRGDGGVWTVRRLDP